MKLIRLVAAIHRETAHGNELLERVLQTQQEILQVQRNLLALHNRRDFKR